MAMCPNYGHRLHQTDKPVVAEQRMDVLMKQMAKAQNVTEELKATDQMEWVRQMNNIRQSAEEIVLNEIIYTL